MYSRLIDPDAPNNVIFGVNVGPTHPGQAAQSAASAGRSKSPAQHLWTWVERPLIWSSHLFLHWHRHSVSELLDTVNPPNAGFTVSRRFKRFFLWCSWRFFFFQLLIQLDAGEMRSHLHTEGGFPLERSRQSMCGQCWAAARKSLSIPLKVGPDVCHYLYW